MYSHNHNRITKRFGFFVCLFLHFVQKLPVRGKCCFQILLYNFYNVCSLVVHEEYKEKVYLTLKVHIRNKIYHPPFVVKMPKLVISLTDNEEKQNCSKQRY